MPQTPANPMPILSLEQVLAAHERIRPHIRRTPLLESVFLNDLLGARLLFKAEVLQKTGAFKYRGAVNFLAQLVQSEQVRGVVSYSSGNHAQALAAVAHVFGIPATIVMPEDAPQIKIEGTRYYGAKVVLYNRQTENRVEIAEKIVEQTGAILVPPFDHPWIMAGQGTVALEILEDLDQLQATTDQALIPCSGGGLTAGCATVFRALSPATHVFAVEPEGYDDTQRSLEAGSRLEISPHQATLCDSLALTCPGELTFEINKALLNGVFTADDKLVRQAMQLAFQHLKLVVEPGGAIGLAALLSGKHEIKGQTIVVVLSGGNVDPALFSAVLAELPMAANRQ